MYSRPHVRRLVSVVTFAVLAAAPDRVAGQSPSTSAVLVDRDLSPQAGATVTVAVGRLVAHVEARFIPLRLFPDGGKLRRAGNATYRFAKLGLFDEPQENWLRVANHELFGHGGRIRELFGGHTSYELPAPPPYGRGGGATFFEYTRVPTVEEALAVTVGGMEANQMMGRVLARDALTSGEWNYRDARRYLYAEYDTVRYIRGVRDVEPHGHDVGDFIEIYNGLASSQREQTISPRMLRRRVLVSFANPLIAYSYYSTFISYVWLGRTNAAVPMVHLGGTRYLPRARFQLTPFGTEWTVDNDFVRGGRWIGATLHVGQTIGARTWGVGLAGTKLAGFRRWTIDGEGNVWRQPEWGGELAATVRRDIARVRGGPHALAIVIEGGAKTNGFLAGERIHQGAFIRVGAAISP